MNAIIFQRTVTTGSSRGSLNLFRQNIDYHLSNIADVYHTPDDACLMFYAQGKLYEDRTINLYIKVASTEHSAQSTIHLSYKSERVMTAFMENDILKILAHHGLTMLYSKKGQIFRAERL